MAEVRFVYFLEDRAQESLVVGLVRRIAAEVSLPQSGQKHHVLSARGGSRMLAEFRDFISLARRNQLPPNLAGPDIVVVARDGNCKGPSERIREFEKTLKDEQGFAAKMVFAIPNPHIERWYLLDTEALSYLVVRMPSMPRYKCKKDYYKGHLRDAIQRAGVASLLGGLEFGEEISQRMD